jgi:hypothetical protein
MAAPARGRSLHIDIDDILIVHCSSLPFGGPALRLWPTRWDSREARRMPQ